MKWKKLPSGSLKKKYSITKNLWKCIPFSSSPEKCKLRSYFCYSARCVHLFLIPWTEACQASLSFTISWSLLKLMSIQLMMPSSHLSHCHPLILLPSIFPNIRVFPSELTLCIRWPKYWSFSFNISPSNDYSGLISFRIDSFDLFAAQGTLKNLLQHHS